MATKIVLKFRKSLMASPLPPPPPTPLIGSAIKKKNFFCGFPKEGRLHFHTYNTYCVEH